MNNRIGRLSLALALTLIILAFRSIAPMPSDGWLFLLIAPIAIVAVEFSLRGGFAAALAASVVVIGFKFAGGIGYTYTGVAIRIAAFFIAGAWVGYLVAERRKRDEALQELERRAIEHEEGLRLNDDIVQGLAVAKLALEMGDLEKTRLVLETTLRRAREIASQRLSHEGPLTRSPSDRVSASE